MKQSKRALCVALLAALAFQVPGFEFYRALAADFSRADHSGGHALTGAAIRHPEIRGIRAEDLDAAEPLPELGSELDLRDHAVPLVEVHIEGFEAPEGDRRVEKFFEAERKLGVAAPEGSRFQEPAKRMDAVAQGTAAFGDRGEPGAVETDVEPDAQASRLSPLGARAPPSAETAPPAPEPAKKSYVQELLATFSYVIGSWKKVPTGDPQKPFKRQYTPPHPLVFATAILGFLTTYYVSDILEFIILPALTPQVPLPSHLYGIALLPALAGSAAALFGAGQLLQRWSQGAYKPLPPGAGWKAKAQAILERFGFDFSKKAEKAFSILAINGFIRSIGEKVYSMMQTFLMSSLNLGTTGVGALRNYTWAAMVLNRPLTGAYADRIPMKKGYVISEIASLLIFAAIPAILYFDKLTALYLFALSFASSMAGQIASSITQNRMQNAIAGSQDEVRSWGNVAASRWRNYGTFIGILLGMILVGNPSIANAAAVKTMFEIVLFGYVGLRAVALALFAFFVAIPEKEAKPAGIKPASVSAPPEPALKLEMPSQRTLLGWIADALRVGGLTAAAGAVLLWAGVSFEVFSLGLSLIVAWGVGPQLGTMVANKLLKGGIHGSSETKILAMVRVLAFPPLAIVVLLAGVYFPGFLPQWAYLVAVSAGLIGAYILSEAVESILAYTLIQDSAVVPKEDQGKAAAALMTVTYLGAIAGNLALGWLLPKNPTLELFWQSQGAIWAMVIGAVALAAFTAFWFPKMAHLREYIQKVKDHRTGA